MTPRDKQRALVDMGVCADMDEAAHFLVDAGDIDSTTHEELLSSEEAARVYGASSLEGEVCSYCGWIAPSYAALLDHHATSSGHRPS